MGFGSTQVGKSLTSGMLSSMVEQLHGLRQTQQTLSHELGRNPSLEE